MQKQALYSLGCGDRFGREGEAQLAAYVQARQQGIAVLPVWNKSNREHHTVHTLPESVRREADAAVAALKWREGYYVDADHISLANVDGFIASSDFFTLDVAENIGTPAAPRDLDDFMAAIQPELGSIALPGLGTQLGLEDRAVRGIAEKYLAAVQEAGRIYRHIRDRKTGPFAVEISMDETDSPQTPPELFCILAMIAREKIPADTLAPKFSGRFNKGVDYAGDPAQFELEFAQDIAVLKYAVQRFGLKPGLRLSVHSGSDKFAIYPAINRVIKQSGAGLHVKTAGTTWLEEIIGLAEAGGSGLQVAKQIYAAAYGRYDELAAPYAAVIDIHPEALPTVAAVNAWDSGQFVRALRHDQSCPDYNPGFRQLVHVAYKVAGELGDVFTGALEEHRATVARNVTLNLWERHILPIFG